MASNHIAAHSNSGIAARRTHNLPQLRYLAARAARLTETAETKLASLIMRFNRLLPGGGNYHTNMAVFDLRAGSPSARAP